MHKRFLILIGVLASFLWCSWASAEAVKKEKKEAAPQVTANKIDDNKVDFSKIDYSKIQWRTKEQMKALRVKEITGPSVMSAGVFKAIPDHPIVTASPLFDTVGYTTYDLGGNDRISRQIALSVLKNVHVDWTKVSDTANIGATSVLRECYYSSWFNTGVRTTHELKVSGVDDNTRAGFVGMAVTEDGRAVLVYHHVLTVGIQNPGTYIAVEVTPSNGDFPGELNAPDSGGGMCDNGIWPSVATHSSSGPDSVFVHVVAVEGTGSCGNNDFAYARGRGAGSGAFTFTWSPVMIVDSSDDISVIAVASRQSGKVAIVYNRQTYWDSSGSNADLYYIESQNYGRNWVTSGFTAPVNVTNYQPGDPVRASGVLSAVYDEEDSLHIVWVAPLYNAGATASECIIYHWSKATGIDQVADGTYAFDDDFLHARSSSFNLMDPHIAVHDGTADITRKNYLYVTFNQFGPDTSDHSVDGITNGEIYINSSTNGGNTWGAPINITNSATPGCDRTCDDDINPTCAERANDTIHISYLNDKSAGFILNGQGGPTVNPVYYYKKAAYKPAPFVGIAANPPVFDDPVVSPTLASIIDSNFKILNVGNQTLKIDSVKKAGVSAWLTILTTSFPDSIQEGGTAKKVDIKFNGTGLVEGTYVDTIIVKNNSANKPRLAIPIHLVVTACGYFKRTHVVAKVGDFRFKVANTTNYTDQDLTNGFYVGSAGENLCFDGSSIMATTIVGDTLTLLDINQNTQVHTLSNIDTVRVTYPDSITFAQAKSQQRPAKPGTYLKIGPVYLAMFYPDASPSCLWPGPWFKYWICQTWYIPVGPKPRYVLSFNKIYKAPKPCWWPLCGENLLTGNLYAGGAWDWDLPSDTGGVINTGGATDADKFVYQQGDGPVASKIFLAVAAMVDTNVHIGNPDGFYSAKLHRNADFYPDDTKYLYKAASDSGFKDNLAPIDTLPAVPADRHIVFASVCFDTTKDTVTYVQAFVFTDSGGYDGLKSKVNDARLAMRLPLGGGCTDFAGDANGSGSISLPDITVLVNFIFKGGPKPNPACRGDCNNSNTITLPDITILVNYIFKGGPKPAKDVDGPCCK